MAGETVEFDGVIVGFESPEGFDAPSVFVQGSVGGEQASFYLLLPREKYEELLRLGVGQMISGVARIVSRDPLVLEFVRG